MNVPAAGPRLARLVCVFACLALASVLEAPAASGWVPDPSQWDMPRHINLVGTDGTTLDPLGEFVVLVRDIAGSPWPGVTVSVDFPSGTDIRLATGPLLPGAAVNCTSHSIRMMTDGNGIARFRVVGSSSGGAPTTFGSTVRIYVESWLGTTISAGTFDLDGSSGVGGSDLAIWLTDFGVSTNPARSDYDGDGVVGGADLAIWLDVFGMGGSGESGTAWCP